MIPDRWLRIAVAVRDAISRDLVADLLIGSGGRAVIEDDESLVTYVMPPPAIDEFVAELERALAGVPGVGEPEFSWQPHEDWESAWREGLAPRRIGRRVVVTPTWIDPAAEPDDVIVRIDPGVAFGTAEHATTRLALALMERVVRPGDTVLDVGTGSGILAIAAVGLGAERVHALDNDPLACDQARVNLVQNGIGSRVEVQLRSVQPDDELGCYQGVVANIVSGVLLPLLPPLIRALAPGGWLVVSGTEAHRAERSRTAVEARGLSLFEQRVEEGWWAGVFEKPGSEHGRVRPG